MREKNVSRFEHSTRPNSSRDTTEIPRGLLFAACPALSPGPVNVLLGGTNCHVRDRTPRWAVRDLPGRFVPAQRRLRRGQAAGGGGLLGRGAARPELLRPTGLQFRRPSGAEQGHRRASGHPPALSGTGVSGPSATQYASQDEVVEGQVGDRVGGLYGVVSQTSVGGSSKGGSSGGSSNVVNINEIIAAREKQMAQERVLLGLSGEQQEAQRIYYDLLKQNEKADVQLTNTELRGAADVIAAYEEQNRVIEENRKQQEDLADYIANSMGDALMGVVDGTMSVKDAFKSMAADIIKELYRVLVVQKLVAGVKTFLGYADGGVISGGTEVQAYANGGVVNGPTTFPMNGGKTGLMGEAGPEAIMPLKRGSNGKLGVQMEGGGGGDNIVINQSFNFQANGDDSVKKLIAQAAPKIADMAKASVIESRRRGGSTKAAFG